MSNLCQVFISTRGKDKINIDGYSFNRNNRIKNKCYWQCEMYKSLKCSARVVTKIENQEHEVLSQSGLHTNDPDSTRLVVADFLNELKENAIVNEARPSRILQHAIAAPSSDVAKSVPSRLAMTQLIKRQRLSLKPDDEPEPTSIEFNHQ